MCCSLLFAVCCLLYTARAHTNLVFLLVFFLLAFPINPITYTCTLQRISFLQTLPKTLPDFPLVLCSLLCTGTHTFASHSLSYTCTLQHISFANCSSQQKPKFDHQMSVDAFSANKTDFEVGKFSELTPQQVSKPTFHPYLHQQLPLTKFLKQN